MKGSREEENCHRYWQMWLKMMNGINLYLYINIYIYEDSRCELEAKTGVVNLKYLKSQEKKNKMQNNFVISPKIISIPTYFY